MSSAVAIVGMACIYPDARSPVELWENVLSQRRAFRRIPPERLRLEDYLSPDGSTRQDSTYAVEAALIEGYEFDRVGFRVAGNTFRSTDLAHWLALDVASMALADAGFPEGKGLPRDTTGVLLGNTLTGEFSRANGMRLRWPYVRRVVEAALKGEDWPPEQRSAFLGDLEALYKRPFPPVTEETLAGGLSNTIAGRICNYFDLKGGGYTVDGACASSLLAATTACSAIAGGDLDVALAGGVDLSLDPFELVGFAKMGALAPEEMRVYDALSDGFWPGEGCGFVVLMRHGDAVAQRRRIYAVIKGWGISSDGSGGITRPEVAGQLLALRRAYRRAGFGIETVPYFEGHGTGTSVGDAVELRALSQARREGAPRVPPAAIGSIKANIGHTKAAAGVAGLIKATMAVHTQILAPTTGCEELHPELTAEAPALRVLKEGELWSAALPLRAGVSAMGFGGINTHLVLEGVAAQRRRSFDSRERVLLCSPQDAELLLLSAKDEGALQQQVQHLLTLAPRLSRGELADLAAHLATRLEAQPTRAAVVASSPTELADRLKMLQSWLTKGVTAQLDLRSGVFLGAGVAPPCLGFLFPGQGSPIYRRGGAWSRRFESVQEQYTRAAITANGEGISTSVAQPAIVTASLAALRVLDRLGVRASVAIGHSLGELAALHWAGALDEEALLRTVIARGRAMAKLPEGAGMMASVAAGRAEVEALIAGEPVVVAGLNSPHQTVVSGATAAVAAIVDRARARGLNARNLPVSHAFHSPLVAEAVPALAEQLSSEKFRPLQRTVVSTVTGAPLAPDVDLRQLLCRQVTAPVRFMEGMAAVYKGVDLFIEVGPGQVLSGLTAEFIDTPVVALDAGGGSLKGLLQAVGAAFALGAPVSHGVLFAGRLTKPFDLDWCPRFFANPCELAPVPEAEAGALSGQEMPWELEDADTAFSSPPHPDTQSPLDLVRQLVAARVELPPSAVKTDHRLLSDLHLNSITVSQLVVEAARRLGLPPPVAPTDYADVTVARVAQALEELARVAGSTPLDTPERLPSGVDSWIRSFTVGLAKRPLPRRRPPTHSGDWQVIAPSGYPLADLLKSAFAGCKGSGVVVCLPPEPDESQVGLLLKGSRAALAEGETSRFVLVQHGGGAAAFARTLHLEAPWITTCVVDLPLDHPKATEWVVAEALAAVKYSEAHYDSSGQRWEPVLRLLPPETELGEAPLGPDDVLLVTGGGKGIAAECALALGRETGVRLALMGRSQPATDAELSANLERMAAAGIHFRYIAADVTDAEAVQAALGEVERALAPITAILHGAGLNAPRPIRNLDESAFLKTLAPKVQGARNLLAAINPDRLRLFITFGSIIARTGLPGEADYGVANEWLSRLTERWQEEHPTCRCLAVEWSLWSGVGMGERLGRVEALVRQGITPITPDEGILILRRLLAEYGHRATPPAPVSVVVTGRFGEAPTLRVEHQDLPFLRFLEWPRVYYPGVELVVDAELSTATDPYLEDHVFRGERLFPATMGLEAMAQTAMALIGSAEPPVFEDVKFSRPIVVPRGAPLRIRTAALVRGPDRVEVVLRSEETAFQADHFQATCRFGAADSETGVVPDPLPDLRKEAVPVSINPERDLYGGILFHSGRFRRLGGYRRLRSTACLAEIGSEGATNWFGRYLPSEFVLGDPAARDAAIHAVQACIPHATLLPIGVDRLLPSASNLSGPRLVHARERSREGNNFIYDLVVTNADGTVQEQWDGLRLRLVGAIEPQDGWSAPLLGPYIERRVPELIPGSAIAVAVDLDQGTDRQARSQRAIGQALGHRVSVLRRPDGKPEVIDGPAVSAAHAGGLTLAVAGQGPIGCDVEPVIARPDSIWLDLLGPEGFALAGVVAREAGEDEAAAATRVWTAKECLKKAGAVVTTPLVLLSLTEDRWVLLKAGPLIVATFGTIVRNIEGRLVLAVLVRGDDANL